ncbi:response regulator [Mucilaginibacter sp.]
MKKLLIHANNTSLNTEVFFGLAEEFVFDVDMDKDVDEYIDDKLKDSAIRNKILESEVLFIKLSLSNSYLEFLGLRVANHIRLTESLGEKSLIPIVFIGEESYEFVAKFAPEPSIFFTKGVYLVPDSKAGYEKAMKMQQDGRIQRAENIAQVIDRLIIHPPADHLSHHSITNEWSVLRWAKSLQIDHTSNFSTIKQRIEQLLYYKYLKYKYPFPDYVDLAVHHIKGSGKVLLIDDEWRKGWGYLFREFFNNTRITFSVLEGDYKDKHSAEIVSMCDLQVKTFDPDLVILDLRLTDADSSKEPGSPLTGHLVLESIKKTNPGIQVILLTASNKIWNLDHSSDYRTDGFILKESPEMSADSSYSKRSIEKLAKVIDKSLAKSFLKVVHVKCEILTALTSTPSYSGDAAFVSRLRDNLAVTFKLLDDTNVSLKYFNYAYLQLFQIIEDFTKQLKVFNEDDESLVYVDDKEVIVKRAINSGAEFALNFQNGKYIIHNSKANKNPKWLDTNFKVSAILIFRYGNENSSVKSWTPIYNKRNNLAAHYNTGETITAKDIMDIMDFLIYFIDDSNQDAKNWSKGLDAITMANKMQNLVSKYKK